MPDDRDEELIRTRRSKQREKKRKKQEKEEQRSRRQDNSRQSRPIYDNRIDLDFPEEEVRYTKYYMAVSNKYKAAQSITIISLVIFLVVMLIFFHDNITYANLLYLVRDLDSATEVNAGTYSDIVYDSKYTTNISLFKNGIAVCGSNGFKLYGSAGGIEIDSTLSYAKPRLEVGDKYAIVYDDGGKDFAIYTTLARVHYETSEKTIEDIAVSDSGNYALLTRADDSKFLVTCYDDSFKAQTKYYKDKYVIDIALSGNGKEVVIVSADSDGTDISSEIMIGKIGTEESKTITYSDQMPAFVSYSDDGTIIVVMDKSVVGIRDGSEVWSYVFEGAVPNKFSLDKNIFTISMSNNAIGSDNTILAFDMNGNELLRKNLDRKVSEIASDGTSTVYVAGNYIATKIVIADGKSKEEEYTGEVAWLLATESGVMVCASGTTTSLFLGE